MIRYLNGSMTTKGCILFTGNASKIDQGPGGRQPEPNEPPEDALGFESLHLDVRGLHSGGDGLGCLLLLGKNRGEPEFRKVETNGQSYKTSTIVIYDSRVVPD